MEEDTQGTEQLTSVALHLSMLDTNTTVAAIR